MSPLPDPPAPFVILLVEDEAADAHLVKLALREHRGHTDLRLAGDGIEALAFLRRDDAAFAHAPRPNLILLDLNMPRMNGRELLAVLKADPELREIPVVVLTTSEAEQDVSEAYKLGAAGFVSKPVELEQFFAAIHQLHDYWFHLIRLPEQKP